MAHFSSPASRNMPQAAPQVSRIRPMPPPKVYASVPAGRHKGKQTDRQAGELAGGQECLPVRKSENGQAGNYVLFTCVAAFGAVVAAVSYTHLDVYKRQRANCSTASMNFTAVSLSCISFGTICPRHSVFQLLCCLSCNMDSRISAALAGRRESTE